jgi:hypothetical protein
MYGIIYKGKVVDRELRRDIVFGWDKAVTLSARYDDLSSVEPDAGEEWMIDGFRARPFDL